MQSCKRTIGRHRASKMLIKTSCLVSWQLLYNPIKYKSTKIPPNLAGFRPFTQLCIINANKIRQPIPGTFELDMEHLRIMGRV